MIKPVVSMIQTLFDHSKEISSSDISFSPEVRKLCEQNVCGSYGKCWTCPPAVGSLSDLHAGLSEFNRFIIYYKVYPLENSFDWEAMMDGAKNFQSRTLKLKKYVREECQEMEALVLGAGGCQICGTCSYTQNKPCNHPEDALVSVEAFGIDAMTMMRENGLKYNNGPNTVTYIGGLFFHRPM